MGIFQLETDSYEELTEFEIIQFIDQTFRVYVEKLPGVSEDYWFYSWVDEMSGTLRCSAGPATSANDLPFGCQLATTDKPTPIAKEFLACPYLRGIPIEKLDDSETPTRGKPSPLVLTVFARRFADA
jgi:hypothetical protein